MAKSEAAIVYESIQRMNKKQLKKLLAMADIVIVSLCNADPSMQFVAREFFLNLRATINANNHKFWRVACNSILDRLWTRGAAVQDSKFEKKG